MLCRSSATDADPPHSALPTRRAPALGALRPEPVRRVWHRCYVPYDLMTLSVSQGRAETRVADALSELADRYDETRRREMRELMRYFRDDLMWTSRSSRVAENILLETDRQRRPPYWQPHKLTYARSAVGYRYQSCFPDRSFDESWPVVRAARERAATTSRHQHHARGAGGRA